MNRTPEVIKKGLECCRCRYEDHMLKSCTSKCPYFHEGSFCTNVLHGDTLAYVQQIEAQVPKWISVDEDIPVNTDDVLVLIGGKDVDVGYFEGYEGCWRTYGCVIGAVTHWMPLPKLPKEG